MASYFSLSNLVAGFVAVLIGFTSSVILIVQAATSVGASPAEIGSWIFALGISMAITCTGLSLYYRTPILTGWSTSGAALLATSLAGFSLPEAIGAFMFAAALTFLTGITGWFEKGIKYLPRSITAAMLAGILIHFGMNIFTSMKEEALLIICMVAAYLFGKRLFSRYTIIFVLMIGIVIAQMLGLFHLNQVQISLATPIFVHPVFTWAGLISIGIPLFVITLTTHNIPGVAILQASGYSPPLSPLMSWIGFINVMLAPFGSYSICLTSLTAAICTGPEADVNPKNRYKATIFAGLCWLFIGIFGAAFVTLFYAFPSSLVLALAGLALLSTMASSLKTALEQESEREPALITFLVAASGISFFGIGAAFWGLIAGMAASFILNFNKKERIMDGKMA